MSLPLALSQSTLPPTAMPQTRLKRHQTGNEQTKGGTVSVTAARNRAIGTETGVVKLPATVTTVKMTLTATKAAISLALPVAAAAAVAATASQAAVVGIRRRRRQCQFLRSGKMTWNRIWLALLLAAVGFGNHLVVCSTESAAQLTTSTRSTLPDRPMTTQNDLITPDSSSSSSSSNNGSPTPLTVKKPKPNDTTAQTGTEAEAAARAETTSSWGTSDTAPTITTTARTKSAQIGPTTRATITVEAAQTAMPPTTATATATTTTTTATPETMLISTTANATAATSTTTAAAAAAAAVAISAASLTVAETEDDANNSVEAATSLPSSEENAVLLPPHPGNADALTEGFSIPTFLPPFPVFAAADLPAYRAAAAAAEAEAAAAAAAVAAAAAAAMASQTTALSPEQQRQQIFNEQHLYLAEHNGQPPGQPPRRNLTMPVLNMTAQMGNHAYMPCQIHRLSDKPVSWVRIRDGHIISVDETTFIADERFQSIYQLDHDYAWSLQIKYVQPNDAGWYECQMATEPKLSARVHLDIVTPKTELIGDLNRFVKAGSKVALHCIVRGTLDPPKYIIWFRGQKKVSEHDEQTGWYTQIDRNIFGNVGDNQNTIGSLIIPFVRKEDSGNYTCQPSNSVSVSVDLHVLSGEYSASAIMSKATRPTARRTFQLLTSVLATTLVLALLRCLPEAALHRT